MLQPQIQSPTPNAIYAKQIVISSHIDESGVLWGSIDSMQLQQAIVSPTGQWVDSGIATNYSSPIQFTFDNEGNIRGLPTSLAGSGTDFMITWMAIEQVLGDVNSALKLC